MAGGLVDRLLRRKPTPPPPAPGSLEIRCPVLGCEAMVTVPRANSEITMTCPKCMTQFDVTWHFGTQVSVVPRGVQPKYFLMGKDGS